MNPNNVEITAIFDDHLRITVADPASDSLVVIDVERTGDCLAATSSIGGAVVEGPRRASASISAHAPVRLRARPLELVAVALDRTFETPAEASRYDGRTFTYSVSPELAVTVGDRVALPAPASWGTVVALNAELPRFANGRQIPLKHILGIYGGPLGRSCPESASFDIGQGQPLAKVVDLGKGC